MPWVHRLTPRGVSMVVTIPYSVIRHRTWKDVTHVYIEFTAGILTFAPLTAAQLRERSQQIARLDDADAG